MIVAGSKPHQLYDLRFRACMRLSLKIELLSQKEFLDKSFIFKLLPKVLFGNF
jgi:hypothetical protein